MDSTYAAQIESLKPSPGDLLVIYPPTPLTKEQHEACVRQLTPVAEKLKCTVLVSQPGIGVALQPDPAAVLAEMRKHTAILEQMAEHQAMLLQALADDGDNGGEEPSSYLSGKPR